MTGASDYAGRKDLPDLVLFLVGIGCRLGEAVTGDGPVFPRRGGGYRDSQNVERDFRAVREGTGFAWVVPHTYRKTVATLMDRGGLSARTIADQLGTRESP